MCLRIKNFYLISSRKAWNWRHKNIMFQSLLQLNFSDEQLESLDEVLFSESIGGFSVSKSALLIRLPMQLKMFWKEDIFTTHIDSKSYCACFYCSYSCGKWSCIEFRREKRQCPFINEIVTKQTLEGNIKLTAAAACFMYTQNMGAVRFSAQ